MKRRRDRSLDEALRKLGPADFDGHTDFAKWTPEQRLDWLGQVIAFVHECKGAARKHE